MSAIEREVTIGRVNPAKKKPGKKAPKKSASKPKSSGTKKKRTSRAAASAPAPRRRRRPRKKNPSFDVAGLALAAGAGAISQVIIRPAAHFAGSFAEGTVGKAALQATGALVVGGAAAMATALVSPAASKGVAGATGAEMTRSVLDTVAKADPKSFLHTLGYGGGVAVNGLPENYFVRDGQLYARAADGTETLLLKFNPKEVVVQLEGGETQKISLLAGVTVNGRQGALVQDRRGKFHVIDGGKLAGYVAKPSTAGLGAYVERPQLSGYVAQQRRVGLSGTKIGTKIGTRR